MVFPFSYGFPMIFPFSYGFPMIFPLSYGFPMIFPFSYGFPMVFQRVITVFSAKSGGLQQFFCHGHLVTAERQEDGQHLLPKDEKSSRPENWVVEKNNILMYYIYMAVGQNLVPLVNNSW